MALDLEAIKEALRKPVKRQVLHKAALLQERIRFHTETNMALPEAGMQATLFLEWVKGLLPKDKFNVFLQLFRLPVCTVSLTEDIYRELERVFYSRNASSSYSFSDTALNDDWEAYRKDKLREPYIWRTTGWKVLQTAPNSVLVVDLPEEQSSDRPEPYFYWLGLERIIDYRVSERDDEAFEWLLFKHSPGRVAVFDDVSLRVFEVNDRWELGPMVSEAVHGLGYCPARFFWSESVNSENPDIKKNPITKELSELDWYLFFSLSKRHLDLYAPYPIYSAYESDCDFENSETGDYCDGGFLRNSDGEYKILADGSIERCPCCSEKRIAGPGSFIEVPVPSQTDGTADLRNPVQITTVDNDSLTYNVNECARLRDEIIISVIGSGGTVSEKEAINETQVAANFESKTAVLMALKGNFESAQRFVDDTVCRLRYGEAFLGSNLNWGTEFYIFTVNELYGKYNNAKASGASMAELDAIMQQILEVEYKNNPAVLQRMMILRQLEPYQNKTAAEVLDLYNAGLASRESVLIKINFMGLIAKFERENINITEFAANKTLAEKINIINEKLLEYVSDEFAGDETGNGGPGERKNDETGGAPAGGAPGSTGGAPGSTGGAPGPSTSRRGPSTSRRGRVQA